MDADLGHFLTNAFGERYLYAVNRNVFNAVGSGVVFQRHFGDALKSENTFYIVVGTDSGLLPRHVAASGVPRGSRFLFIELPEVLALLGNEADTESDSIRLALPDDWGKAAVDLDISTYIYLGRVRLIASIGATDAHLEAYRELQNRLDGELLTLTWQVSTSIGSRQFIEPQIRNVAENHTPAMVLKDAFKGRTGVLLAGGPSLDEVLPWVQMNRDRLVVLAVSRIARRLLAVGLTPDIVVSVDPHQVGFDVSKDMLRLPESVVLAAAYHLAPGLMAQWRGPIVFFGDRLPWESPLNIPNIHGAGPTVSNSAIELAVHLGLERLILAGMDLCHSREGHSHAQGSNEYQAGARLDDTGITVETYGGWRAATTPDFHTAMTNLAHQAQHAKAKGTTLINPALGAAKVDSVEHRALDDIELVDAPDPAEQVLRALLSETRKDRQRDLGAVADALRATRSQLREIIKLSEEALRCNDGLFGRNGMKADFKHKKRMDKIERRLDRQFKKLVPLVKNFGMARFIGLSSPVAVEDWTDEEMERYGRRYYEAYRDSASDLLQAIEDALRRTESRLAEEAPAPDLRALAMQWRADQQPGRVRVWLTHRPEAAGRLDQADRGLVAELEREFDAVLDAEDSAHKRRTEQQREQEFRRVPLRMKQLFESGKREDLAALVAQIELLERKHAEVAAAYGAGLLAELDRRHEDALAHYQLLIDRHMMVDEALTRVLNITLEAEAYESAALVLESLANLSPSFMPRYAHLLKLLGRVGEAIDVYTAYLSQAPDDTEAMLRLGQLYRECGVEDAACMAFRQVLEREPDNHAAKTLLEHSPLAAVA